MHTLTLCHVVPLEVLAGAERITQALKIILTTSDKEETRHASSRVCPRLDEPAREE
jgi:hypothetical protein